MTRDVLEVLSQERLNRVLEQVHGTLEAFYGERLKGVYLFGSYARGEAEPGSDVDVAVVLEGPVDGIEEVRRTNSAISDLSLEQGVVVSLLFIGEDHFLNGRSVFLMNFRDEMRLVS